MQHGLAELGIIPRYYGEMRHLDVEKDQPHLRKFLNDKYPPSAMFLEYIPNMEMIVWENYPEERGQATVRGIDYIHKALVLHARCLSKKYHDSQERPGKSRRLDFDVNTIT